MLREDATPTLGGVAGQINGNNRELERLNAELIQLQEQLSID